MSTKFVLWWLRAHESKIANMGTGTTFIAVSKKSLFPLSIPVPPLAEQKRIVAKVDELMALCDQLEQAKNQRDEIRAATRKSAVDAISTAATPEELETAWKRINNNWDAIADTPESVSSLRSLVLDLAVRGMFSDSDSSSWRSSTLGEEVQIIRGITFPSSAKSRTPAKGLVPCLRTANIQDEVDWDDLLYVSEEYIRNDSQLVRVGDLLISMANSRELVGKVALVRKCDFKCTLGGFIAAIRCGTGIEPKFLMTALRVPSARDKLIDSSTQTTNIANISLGRLRPFELNLPPLEEQKRIVKKADELMALCDQLESELKSRSEVAEKFARSVVSAS
jgi:restriction endonuclease S subunit